MQHNPNNTNSAESDDEFDYSWYMEQMPHRQGDLGFMNLMARAEWCAAKVGRPPPPWVGRQQDRQKESLGQEAAIYAPAKLNLN